MKELHLPQRQPKANYFFYSVLAICLSYIIFEIGFIFYSALAPDEFVFARHIYEYTFNIPYRDFPPYKTILGYYILSIPMFFSHSMLAPIFYIKNEIAFINMGCILLASFWATRFFDRRAILVTLLAILMNGIFLIYSTDLRVDMLTSWACLFSILCVMENRIRLGGVLLGLAFLISQKAIWYFLALNGAMIICSVALPNSIFRLRAIIAFNVAVALPILVYITFWSYFGGLQNVLASMFYEAYVQESINVFVKGYLTCWEAVLTRGALLFLLWPMIFLSLFDKTHEETKAHQNFFVIILASIALELFLDYKQPFPYNFVLTIPALFILYNQFITWILQQKETPHAYSIQFGGMTFIFTTFIYLYGIGAIINFLSLPAIHYLTIPLAISLLCYLFFFPQHRKLRKINFAIVIIIFYVLGIIYPLYRSILTANILDGGYQRSMINVAARILQNDGDYIAGAPFLYRKDQPIEGMKNLIDPAANYLKNPDEQTKQLLLPSLYLLPSTQKQVLKDFSKYPVKLLLDNYRFDIIPKSIKTYIKDNYQQYYGSILLYAPRISAGNRAFDLKFDANYRLETRSPVIVDGKKIMPGQIITLSKGHHHSNSPKTFRLVLVPENIGPELDPKYQDNSPILMTRAIIA